ncbi:MAG: glycosyl hydrolase family 28 protein [Eubacteriales bacterium]|nr:glycosyl hydrolase family 28 protein [Eubacteriales bacterium]
MGKMIRLVLSVILIIAVSLTLFACGKGDSENSQPVSSEEQQSEDEKSTGSEESEMEESNGLSVAPLPEGAVESTNYTVTVKYGTNGTEIAVPCYPAKVGMESVSYTGAGEIKNDTMSFCCFESDFDETVYITVTPLKGFENCVIRPLAESIAFTEKDGSITFALNSAIKISVEFDDEIYTNLFIYADRFETEAFTENDTNVIYYGPGVHHAGKITLSSDQTLYIAPGALVYGYVVCTDAENVAIRGRGILSGGELTHRMDSDRYMLCTFDNCKNVTVDGVVFLDSPTWTLRTYCCDDVVINNLKEICWYYNSDGLDICGCENVTITDCFLRNYDDNISIKSFESKDSVNITVSDCVFWADCAHNMLVGPEARAAEYENRFTDITFKNITVLEQNQKADFYKGVMAITCADNAVFDKITWENIIIERMSNGAVINFRYSDDYATYYGKSIGGVTIKNVSCDCVPARGDSIIGLKNNPIADITIINYTLNGKLITFEENNFTGELGYVDSLKIDGDERKIVTGIEQPKQVYVPYLKIISADGGNGSLQASFASGQFEAGKTYTIKAAAKFEDIDQSVGADANQGLGFVNCYIYKSDGTLDAFYDFAKCNYGDADWKSYNTSFTIPQNPGAVTVSIGFWEASGIVSCSEIEILDPNGEVIFFEDFSEGFDASVWKETYKPKSVEIITEEAE